MMKRFLIITAVIGLLASCSNPVSNHPKNKPVKPVKPDKKTFIVFDNTQGICAVSVYDDYRRQEEDKIAGIPAGQLSAEIEYTPGESVPFYFLYTINLKGISGFTLDYVPEIGKDQKAVRIDPGITTAITIPKLDETVSSPDTLLSNNSYLLIQNNSSYSFQLHRGSGSISPDKSSTPLVNSGERAQYTINPGAASPYQLLVGADYKAFSGSITSFEAGHVYSFIFDGAVSLITEVEIKLENVAGIPQDSSGPETPGAPVVTAGDGLLTLRWTAVQGAEQYEVYLDTAQQPPASPEKTVMGTTTVLTGLTNKTAYYIWIKAVNSSGSSDFSPRGKGIPWPLNDIPATPERPVIIPGINQLTVNWDECGGAASYEVYTSMSPSAPSTPEITTDKTSAVITNLENDTIYYIWVRAVNSAGKSGYSPLESGTPTIPTIAPAAPSRPVLTTGNHELAVSWQAVELAAAYEVWLGTSDNFGQAQKWGGDITGGITETVITGLENETTYYVWVRAKNIIGISGFSLPANAKPSAFAVVPETPAAPAVTAGNRELGVSWQSVEGALFYEVWAGLTNNTASAEKYGADVSGTSVTLTGLTNGTTYYLWIKAKNNIGASEFSPKASGTPSAFAAVPSAPQTAPTVIAGSGQLTVSWQTAEGASSYEVWAGSDTNPTLATKRGGDVTGLSSVITGLTNGTTYYVWIKAKNAVGVSSFSPMASGTPSSFSVTPQAPAAPSVSTGNGQITVTWSAVEGATAYELWTGTSNNSSSATKNGSDISASLSATISGLTNGTTYYIWLKAKNNVGTSGFSSVASGKPIADATAPTLNASNGQLSVTWTAIAGADQYDVLCGTGINPPQSATQTVNAPTTSATISGLVNGTTYNVWVRGKNSTGTGAMSNAASAKPIGNMGTVTLASGNGQLTASWSAVAGADQYEVYYNTSSSIPASPAQTVTTTTATISGLTNGTTYYVWVKPKNANGAGNTSTVVSGAPMATPGSLTVSAGNQQITVSWSAVPGASSYEIYYSTTTTIPAEASFTVTGTSRTITGLTNGTTYYVWVKPKNANGTGEASPMASCTLIGNMGTVTLVSANGQLRVSWLVVNGADEYEVYYSTTSTIPASPLQTVSTTTTTISGLTNGTTYYVWVKPKNTNGTGNASTAASGVPSSNGGEMIWTAVSNSTFGTSTILAIAYGNNKFVAVGGWGKIAYSSDGVTWTAVTNSTFNTSDILGIAYGNNKFVAVGWDGKMATSTDGVTWTAVSNSAFNTFGIYAIAYGNNRFVAVGKAGIMAISTDGLTWTAVSNTTFAISQTIEGITYGNNKFVAVGGSQISYSTDGLSWTVSNSTFGLSGIYSIAYGNSKFVAGGYLGKMAYSSDGVTWTAVSNSTFGTDRTINGIAYGNDKFIAVCDDGKMAYSFNGSTWVAVSDSTFGIGQLGRGITYGNGKFVAGDVGKMAYSTGTLMQIPPVGVVITTLTANNWTNGNIATSSGEQWFKFNANAATQYIHFSFGTLDDLYVRVYDSDGSPVGRQENLSGSTKYASRTVTSGQEYYIKVTPSSSSGGTYKIAFNTSTSAPSQ